MTRLAIKKERKRKEKEKQEEKEKQSMGGLIGYFDRLASYRSNEKMKQIIRAKSMRKNKRETTRQ